MVALLATFIIIVGALSSGIIATKRSEDLLSDQFINSINSNKISWRAGRNFPLDTSMKYINNLMGSIKSGIWSGLAIFNHDKEAIAAVPKNFDPRKKWPICHSLNDISEQNSCTSCWAFASTAMMTDRYCIHSNGTKQFHFSVEDLTSCCKHCSNGCTGLGELTTALFEWRHVGIVSGGNYNSKEGCKPFQRPPANYVTGEPVQPLSKSSNCTKTCMPTYSRKYNEDKRYAKNAYSIADNEAQIKAELYKNGPVGAIMEVYADFLHYKSGVYSHVKGDTMRWHAVKILGWGEENGHKYWLAANTWTKKWGDNGFFKILRGVNHCDIESSISAGIPIIV